MGMFAFIKNAGVLLRDVSEPELIEHIVAAGARELDVDSTGHVMANAIADYVKKMNLFAEDLEIDFDAATATVFVQGQVATQEEKEKVLLCCGNVTGVACVHSKLRVKDVASEPVFYIVNSGDTLIKIARELYGNANAYMKIFEANKPMLSHPDKIYPGQTLRIPV